MLGGLSSYFGEVSHSIQTGSVIRRTLFDTGGVVAEDGNVTRRPVPAACRGKTVAAKTVAAKEPYPLEFLTAF